MMRPETGTVFYGRGRLLPVFKKGESLVHIKGCRLAFVLFRISDSGARRFRDPSCPLQVVEI